MYGANPLRTPLKGDGFLLEVQQCFATLQGEGPYAGHPAVFVRLGGCNLACDFCDTEFESFSERALVNVLEEVTRLSQDAKGERRRDLIVITGGEPLRQNIAPLCEALLEAGFRVQIETNGTLFRALPEGVDIICSPKNTGNGYAPLRPDLLARATALKFLVSADDARYRDIPDVGQSHCSAAIYVQPIDANDETRNRENTVYAARLAQEKGYRLSLQLHKILGIE